MSDQNEFVTCHCNSCAGHIEFNSDGFDAQNPAVITCPHCGGQTQLYIPLQSGITPPRKFERVTLTKAQCSTPVGQELINLLSEIEADAVVTEEELWRLSEWLGGKADPDITAIGFLSRVTSDIFSKGQFTKEGALEIQFAIERVLPKDIRTQIIAKRRQAWRRSPASENQIAYLRHLGGTPPDGMTRDEASAFIEQLTNGATERQIKFIRDLGADPPAGLTKSDASALIDQLLERHGPTPRQMMLLRFWNRMDMANWSKNDLSEWMSRFYTEDPRRKAAWEIFKLEKGDDGSQSDPSWVPIGIGPIYLEKAVAIAQQGQGRAGCFSRILLVLVLAVILCKLLG